MIVIRGFQDFGMCVNKITVNRKICEAYNKYNKKTHIMESAIEKKS